MKARAKKVLLFSKNVLQRVKLILRGINYAKIAPWLYLASSLAFLFVFRFITLQRLFSSVMDLLRSFAFWFVFIAEDMFESVFGFVPEVTATVVDIPSIDVQDYIPIDIAELQRKIQGYGNAFFNIEMFSEFNDWLFWKVYWFLYYTSNLFMLPVCLFYCVRELMLTPNGKELGYESPALRRAERIYARIRSVCSRIYKLFESIYDCNFVRCALIVIWLIHFNVITLILQFFAHFYYFMASMDLSSYGSQFLKFIIDLFIGLSGGFFLFWCVLGVVAFDYWRRRIGYDRLHHFEAENCGFAKECNLCSLIVAPMRKGKTAFMTDLKLSWVNIHKRQARDILHKYDFMFPMFPWERFEADFKEAIELGLINSAAHAALYVEIKRRYFDNAPCAPYLYGYDFETYGLEKNVGNKILSIWSAMDTYARAYYVYINDNLDFSNYPIRFDGKFTDSPYLPRWNGEFFETVPGERESRYSHVMDQDVFRQGKKVDPDNPYAGALSIGYYSVMEFGKSEKNQTGLEGVKVDDENANQKNDKYEYSLYMLGHAEVMIDNVTFAIFIADDQRPMAIPAKLRDCFSIITLVSRSEAQLALPFFGVEEFIYNNVYEPFKKFYEDYRDKRGDRTIPSMLFKLPVAWLSNHYNKIYNTFGYFEYDVALESGTSYGEGSPADGPADLYKYRICFKKTFGDRYKTDGQSQFFNKRLLETESNLDDLPCYGGLNMTVDEMKLQHDYFLMELMENIYSEPKQEDKPSERKGPRKNKQPDLSGFVFDDF